MTFQQKLDLLIKKQKSLLCIGLDTDIEKLPVKFKKEQAPQFIFNKYIVDLTHNLVCCYKPNSAFYESHGPDGLTELKRTCDYIRQTYPEIPIILDFKRGDIENTNEGYAQFAFDYLHVDAVTLQPYLGKEALDPFLKQKNKGIMILCKTSNRGSGEFQDLVVSSPDNSDPKQTDLPTDTQDSPMKLYQYVARQVASSWNKHKNCSLVVGATFPEELAEVRAVVGDMTILVPGIGAQGGDLEKTVKAGINSQKSGIILSVSRAILFADNPKEEAQKLRDEINTYR